jgi:hypothetical protein
MLFFVLALQLLVLSSCNVGVNAWPVRAKNLT